MGVNSCKIVFHRVWLNANAESRHPWRSSCRPNCLRIWSFACFEWNQIIENGSYYRMAFWTKMTEQWAHIRQKTDNSSYNTKSWVQSRCSVETISGNDSCIKLLQRFLNCILGKNLGLLKTTQNSHGSDEMLACRVYRSTCIVLRESRQDLVLYRSWRISVFEPGSDKAVHHHDSLKFLLRSNPYWE
jgi:hypothetical protein